MRSTTMQIVSQQIEATAMAKKDPSFVAGVVPVPSLRERVRNEAMPGTLAPRVDCRADVDRSTDP